jgi:hypothetical protein
MQRVTIKKEKRMPDPIIQVSGQSQVYRALGWELNGGVKLNKHFRKY